MMQKLTIPKEAVLEALKGGFFSQYEKQVKAETGKVIKVIDIEWSKDGIVVYYKGDKLS